MGHTAPIQCPDCSAIRDVELKDMAINAADATFTYTHLCDCGYSHSFVDAPITDVERFIPDVSESQRVAESLGISPETYAFYIWPPDVRSAIDKERRKLPESKTKRDLRAAALPLPKQLDERWWVVYKLSHTIVFDPRINTYGFVETDGSIAETGDIVSLVAKLKLDDAT